MRLVERGLEVGVGDERNSAGELDLRLGLDPVSGSPELCWMFGRKAE